MIQIINHIILSVNKNKGVSATGATGGLDDRFGHDSLFKFN